MNNNHTETNALTAVSQPAQTTAMSSASMMMDGNTMDKLIRVADLMATGKVSIPQHLRGNAGDCLAIVMQAAQWGMNPFGVAQKTHLINGTMGYEAQLIASAINTSGAVKDRFHFEWFGDWTKVIGKFEVKRGDKGEYRVPGWKLADEDGLGIKVWATIRGELEPRELSLLLAQARVRNSTLWADDPKQQLAYLAQKRWARLYAPDVILGCYSLDEFDEPAPRDMGQVNEVKPATAPVASGDLESMARKAASEGRAAFAAFYNGLDKAVRPQLRGIRQEMERIAEDFDKSRTVEAKATPVTNTATGEITATFEDVIAKLDKATNEDALYVAYDWANAMEDLSRIPDVEAHFNARLAAIRGE